MQCRKAIEEGICEEADCCGPQILPIEFFEKHKNKILGDYEIIHKDNDFVSACKKGKTKMNCAFLDKDLKCLVYDDRPEVCRLYSTREDLPCPYINLNGNIRSPAKRKRWQRRINHKIDNDLKKLL